MDNELLDYVFASGIFSKVRKRIIRKFIPSRNVYTWISMKGKHVYISGNYLIKQTAFL